MPSKITIIIPLNCLRCGRADKVELHHIKARAKGGSDDAENKASLCQSCHDYEHAKRNILQTMAKEVSRKQEKRASVLHHRLEVLESLNTPELIRERGKYQSWWTDESTHEYPRYEKVSKTVEEVSAETPQLKMELEAK